MASLIFLVDRENTDGDRTIVATFDGEDGGTPTPLELAIERARGELRHPTVYAVRVVWDRPDRDPQLRTLFYCDVRGVERRKGMG